jgi:hypothetical protein
VQENAKGEERVMEVGENARGAVVRAFVVEKTARYVVVHALVAEGIVRDAEQGASAAVENGMPHD